MSRPRSLPATCSASIDRQAPETGAAASASAVWIFSVAPLTRSLGWGSAQRRDRNRAVARVQRPDLDFARGQAGRVLGKRLHDSQGQRIQPLRGGAAPPGRPSDRADAGGWILGPASASWSTPDMQPVFSPNPEASGDDRPRFPPAQVPRSAGSPSTRCPGGRTARPRAACAPRPKVSTQRTRSRRRSGSGRYSRSRHHKVIDSGVALLASGAAYLPPSGWPSTSAAATWGSGSSPSARVSAVSQRSGILASAD